MSFNLNSSDYYLVFNLIKTFVFISVFVLCHRETSWLNSHILFQKSLHKETFFGNISARASVNGPVSEIEQVHFMSVTQMIS